MSGPALHDTITMRCPTCKRVATVRRESHDPDRAVFVETLCPECCEGGFDDVHYFDAGENEITEDPAHPFHDANGAL